MLLGVDASRLLIRVGNIVRPLSAGQLCEILCYQEGHRYDSSWLVVCGKSAYFRGFGGRRLYIVEFKKSSEK